LSKHLINDLFSQRKFGLEECYQKGARPDNQQGPHFAVKKLKMLQIVFESQKSCLHENNRGK